MKFTTAAALLLVSISCAGAENSFPEDVITAKDIPYVPQGHPRQTLDLYLPPHSPGRRLPLVIWIHGGGWQSGSKDWINVKYLVGKGFALASVDYRFSQDAAFPAQIQDCNAALDFLMANAGKYDLDPDRVAVGGGSAGGHLALLLGLARTEKSFGANPAFHPRAILDFFGPSDIATVNGALFSPSKRKEIGDILHQLLGASPPDRPDLAKAASPLTYVTKDAPSVLILHGDKDDTVPLSQSQELHSALDHLEVKNILTILAGAGHDGPIFIGPVVQAKVLWFLDSALANPAHR